VKLGAFSPAIIGKEYCATHLRDTQVLQRSLRN
jgi:hypothetical protein